MSSYQTLFNESSGNFSIINYPNDAVIGYFIRCADSSGSFEWASLGSHSVTSITGTSNQVIVSSSTGDITLSLPQSIATSSSPTFVLVTANLSGNVTGNLTGNLTGQVLTASQSSITTMANLTSINGQAITGADLAKIYGITDGLGAAGKALVLSSGRDIANIRNMEVRNLTLTGAAYGDSFIYSPASGVTVYTAGIVFSKAWTHASSGITYTDIGSTFTNATNIASNANQYNVKINACTGTASAGAFQNRISLYVEPSTGGAVSNYAIYANGASYVNGALTVVNALNMLGANSTTGGEVRLINSALSGFTIFNQSTTLDLNIGKYTSGSWQYNVITIDYASGAITIGKNINSGSNTITAATFIGNLTGNVTGNLTGNVMGNLTGNVTGTILSPAAQPNITSLGTLTSLTMGGSINMGNFNITNADNVISTSFLGALTGQVLTASQGSITTLAGLTSAGSTSATLSILGVLDLVEHNGITKGLKLAGTLVTAGATQLNYLTNVIPGTSLASKALVVDSSNNLSSINSLSATTLSATTLTGTLSTASQPNVTTMAGLVSINGQSIAGSDLLKIVGITNGTPAASKALVLDSSRNATGGSGIHDLTSDGTINSNAILLTNQSGTVASPNISFYQLAGGLYFHKTNQLIGLSDGTSRIIECDKKNNIVNQDYKTQFNNAVTIYNASTDQLVVGTSLTTTAVNYTPAFLYGGSLTSNTVMHLRRLGSTEDLVIAAVGISGNWSSSAAVADAVIRNSSGNVCIQNGTGAAQLIVTSGGIKLTSSGATASNLDFYSTGSFTMNFSGPYTFSDTVYFTRTGKMVNLTFSSQVSNRVTTTNYIQSTASNCPSYLRPDVTRFGFIYGSDNNTGAQLSYAFQNDGKLIIGNSPTNITANFTAGSPVISGYYGFSITHSVS